MGLFSLGAPASARSCQAEAQEASASKKALAKELAELEASFSKARTEVIKGLRDVPAEKQAAYYEANRPKARDYVDRFLDIAERAAMSDVAVDAYAWILRNSQDAEHYQTCMQILLHDHQDDPSLVSIATALVHHPKGDEGLEKLIRQSGSEAVRAHASFRLGKRYVDGLDWGEGPPDAKEKAEAYLESVLANHRDLKLDDGSTLGENAKRVLFALRNLGIGKVAPDIEGVDIDGVPFKLSDYRGKVVVLDFWGHW